MYCEMEVCVYNKDFKCSLKSISITQRGICDECNIVHIREEALEKIKKEQRDIREIEA